MHLSLRTAALAFLLAAVPSCGAEKPYDWKNRELTWTYGPTTDTATREHMLGTGTKGGGPIAAGWHCGLREGTHLTVKPYQLAATHALFGKVDMIVGLFDKTGKQLGTVRSAAITAENATFDFAISEDLAQPLYDLVIWFGEA